MKNKPFRLFPSTIATSSILLAPALHRSCHANDGDGPPPPQDWLRAGLPVKLSARPLFLRLLISCLGFLSLNARAANFSVPFPAPLPAHPRLIASTEDFTALREQVKTDPVSARFFAELSQRAGNGLMVSAPQAFP